MASELTWNEVHVMFSFLADIKLTNFAAKNTHILTNYIEHFDWNKMISSFLSTVFSSPWFRFCSSWSMQSAKSWSKEALPELVPKAAPFLKEESKRFILSVKIFSTTAFYFSTCMQFCPSLAFRSARFLPAPESSALPWVLAPKDSSAMSSLDSSFCLNSNIQLAMTSKSARLKERFPQSDSERLKSSAMTERFTSSRTEALPSSATCLAMTCAFWSIFGSILQKTWTKWKNHCGCKRRTRSDTGRSD